MKTDTHVKLIYNLQKIHVIRRKKNYDHKNENINETAYILLLL